MTPVINIVRGFTIVFATGITLFALAVSADIRFDNVTSTAGSFHTGESWGASWGDLNGDRRPELYANNHRDRSSIYRNNGDGTFTDVVLTVDREGVWLSDYSIGLQQDTHGGTWGDFDNDGDLDLLSTRSSSGGRGQLFVNTGGIFVEEKGSELGLNGFTAGRLGAWFDYNNDGLLDIGAMRASWAKIFKQQGGSFSETTSNVGMYRKCNHNNYLHLLDLTEDGQPEIICGTVTSYPEKIFDTSSDTFQDVTSTIPIHTIINDVVLADFNNDSRMDILKLRGRIRPSQVKRINSDRLEAYFTVSETSGEKGYTFQASGAISIPLIEVERASKKPDAVNVGSGGWNPSGFPFTLDPSDSSNWGLKQDRSKRGVYIGYDTVLEEWTILVTSGGNSSRDAYIVVDGTGLTEPTTFGVKNSELPQVPRFLVGAGSGGYQEAFDFGIPEVWCNSVTAGDFDNDMDVDVFMACRGSVENLPNRLFENQGDGTFIEVPTGGGAGGVVGIGLVSGVGNGESVVMADYDVDGFLDLFVTNGAALVPPGVGGPDELFHNQGNSNNWIEIDLEGTTSNRDGIGAKVYAITGGITQFREQNGGYHRWSQNHMRIHFGLAASESVNLRVEWPSGNVDQFNGVVANNLYHLKESGDIQAVTLGPVPSFPMPQPGDECGTPAYDKREDKKMFLWKDCNSGEWNFRVTSGGSTDSTIYSGEFASDDLISSVVGFSFEGGDNIDVTDPYKIIYELFVGGNGHDGIAFQAPSATKTCLFVGTPGDVELLVGAKMLPAEFPFNLATLSSEGCSAISINDVTVNENSGSAKFAVSLSPANSGIVTVEYTTRNGTATDGQDYVGTTVAEPIQFASGETLQTITIPILDDTTPEGMEMFEVVLSNPINAQIGDGTGDGIILDDENSACGMPTYDPSIEQGAFLWEDCDGSNAWHFVVTAGGSATRLKYVGQFDSVAEFTSVIGQNIEGGDTLDFTTDPTSIDFLLKATYAGWDGFDFTSPAGTSVCLNMILPTGSQLMVGASMSTVSLPLDLETLGVCSAPPVDEECGAPSYDPATEQALFLWKDCESTGMWHVTASAGGSATRVDYAGLVGSVAGFTSVIGRNIEGGDTLDYSTDPSLIDFYLKVTNAGWDSFAFDFPAGANTCFDLTSPAGSQILLGSGKVPKMAPLDLGTLGTCP